MRRTLLKAAALLPLAARASAQVNALCRTSVGRGAVRAWYKACNTRRRISPAALRVKVMATISSGSSTCASSTSSRCISSSVLPEPAGACTMKERDASSASVRTAASSLPCCSDEVRGETKESGIAVTAALVTA
jgi:hypothetical protein